MKVIWKTMEILWKSIYSKNYYVFFIRLKITWICKSRAKNLITHCPVPEDWHKNRSKIGEQSEGKLLNRGMDLSSAFEYLPELDFWRMSLTKRSFLEIRQVSMAPRSRPVSSPRAVSPFHYWWLTSHRETYSTRGASRHMRIRNPHGAPLMRPFERETL